MVRYDKFARRSCSCFHALAAASCGRSAIQLSAKRVRVISSLKTWMRLLTTRYATFGPRPTDPSHWSLTLCSQALHDTFVAFGNVLSCKVAVDEQSNSKGYGFVHYETAEAAENAIKAVNGMLLNDKKVFVGHHIPKKVNIVVFVIIEETPDFATGEAVQARGDSFSVHQSLRKEH